MSSNSKVAVIAGYGSGISAAVAKKFAAEGYKIALLARTQSRLDAAAEELSRGSVTAKGYSTDLSDIAAVKNTIAAVHDDLGPISVLIWNPYGKAANLLTAPAEDLVVEFNTAVVGLLQAVQAAHEDLKATKGSVLVTGGGLYMESDAHTQLALDWGAANLAVAKAAQRKLVHLLSKGLAKDGIYAGEVTVMGLVKGTAWDDGKTQLTPESIAEEFWEMHQKKDPAVWYVHKGSLDSL